MRFPYLLIVILAITGITLKNAKAQENVVFRGQVLDPNGATISNAKVKLHASYDYSPNWQEVEQNADEQGRFEYSLPRPVTSRQKVSLHITASNDDCSLLENTQFQYTGSSQEWTYGFRPLDDVGLVKTKPTQRIELKLVSPDGLALPRTKVWYFDADKKRYDFTPHYYFFSNDEGLCEVFLPGRFTNSLQTFVAHSEGYPRTKQNIDISKVNGPVEIQIDTGISEGAPLIYRGQVLSPDHTPLRGAKVTIDEFLASSTESTEMIADEEGRFSYTLKGTRPHGTYAVQAIAATVSNDDSSLLVRSSYHFEWFIQQWTRSDDGVVRITPHPTTKVETILFDQNQTRIRHGKVWFYHKDKVRPNSLASLHSQNLSFEVGKDWKCDVFILGETTNKKFTFVAAADGFGMKEVNVDLTTLNSPLPITLQPGQSHTVTVKDELGQPLAGAIVVAVSFDAILLGGDVFHQRVNQDGQTIFKFVPLNASRARFRVHAPGYDYVDYDVRSDQQTGWPESSLITLKKNQKQ